MFLNAVLSCPVYCGDTKLSLYQQTSVFTRLNPSFSQGSITPITRGRTLGQVIFSRDVQEMQAGKTDYNSLGQLEGEAFLSFLQCIVALPSLTHSCMQRSFSLVTLVFQMSHFRCQSLFAW